MELRLLYKVMVDLFWIHNRCFWMFLDKCHFIETLLFKNPSEKMKKIGCGRDSSF